MPFKEAGNETPDIDRFVRIRFRSQARDRRRVDNSNPPGPPSPQFKGRILGADEARRAYEDIVRTKRDPALLEYVNYGLYRTSAFPLLPGFLTDGLPTVGQTNESAILKDTTVSN